MLQTIPAGPSILVLWILARAARFGPRCMSAGGVRTTFPVTYWGLIRSVVQHGIVGQEREEIGYIYTYRGREDQRRG
jgi:uncharacterized membrane protein YjgN (DUF898 family)